MVSRIVTQAAAVLLGVVLVRMVSEQTLGTYRQAFLVYYLIAALIAFRLETSLYYFVPTMEPGKRRVLVLQTILATAATSLGIGAVLFFGSGIAARLLNNEELVSLVRVLWLYPLVDGLSLLVPAYMVSVERAVRAGVYGAAASIVRVGVVVGAFALGLGLPEVLRLSVLAVGAVATLGCAEMLRLSPPGPLRFDREIMLGQFRYTWPLWITTAVGVLNIRFDKFLISNAFDPATYAVYSCGAFEIPLAFLVTSSIAMGMMPTLVSLARGNRVRDVLSIWQEAARKGSLIIFPSFALLLPLSRDLIVFLYTPDYAMAAWPFAIYLFALPVHVVLYSAFLRAVGRTRPIAVSAGIGLGVNVAVSVFLVWLGRGGFVSFIGPSVGTVCSVIVAAAYMVVSIGSTAGVPVSRVMRWGELGRVLMLSAGAGLVVHLLPLPDIALAAELAARAAVFLAVLAPAAWVTGMLKEDERRLITAPLRAARRLLSAGRDEGR